MACVLYREGKGTTDHDIECESVTCEPDDVEGLLEAGWLPHPPGYVAPEPVVAEEPDEEEPEGEDVDADLVEQIASLNAQVEILLEMDEKSKAEIARLTEELSKAEADIEALLNAAPVEEQPADEVFDSEGSAGDGDESNLNPVRIAAREAGIEGWDTKRIGTLENLLSEK